MSQSSSFYSEPPRKRNKYTEDHGKDFQHHHSREANMDPVAISTMISSFHHQVRRLLELLRDGNATENANSLAVAMGGHQMRQRHRRHGRVELRQCLRTIQQLLSQHDKLECLWNGAFFSVDVEELTPESDDVNLRRREELHLFVDDLLAVVCLEDNCEDASAAALLNSTAVEIAGTALPNILQAHPLSQEQLPMLVKRVFYIFQDVNEELSYQPSPDVIGRLNLLETIVSLLNEQLSPEVLGQIMHPSEAIPALQFPLDLLCQAESGGVQSSQLTRREEHSASQQARLSPPESLSYSLRVFFNTLLQHVNQLIVRDHEQQQSHHAAAPSIRGWLEQQRQKRKNAKRSGAQDIIYSPNGTHGETEFVAQEDNGGLTISGVSSVKHLIRMLDQYGNWLLDETMRMLQEVDSCNLDDEDNQAELNYSGFSEVSRPCSPIFKEMTSAEKIESIMRMTHLTADFLFAMDSEEAIASSPTMFGDLRSLWKEFSSFVLDAMAGGLANQENDELQAAVTEILFRLTKHYIGIQFRRETVPVRQMATPALIDDETCGLITTIFRLMQETNGESWNREGKEWVAYLLEKHPHKGSLQQTLYAALFALVSCPEEGQFQDNIESKYCTLMGLTGLDDSEAVDGDIQDPWKLYARDVLFSSSK